jgi:hypothetical protein
LDVVSKEAEGRAIIHEMQQLKLLASYLMRMYCLSCSTFSGMGAQGRMGGVDEGISH